MSESQSGSGNSGYGKRWIHNKKIQKNIRFSGTLPDGWEEGRVINWYGVCCYCDKSYAYCDGISKQYCSVTCKRYDRAPAQRIIDDNEQAIIADFMKTKSITQTLKNFGVTGVREGNVYLSKILKRKGIDVLRRRNTAVQV